MKPPSEIYTLDGINRLIGEIDRNGSEDLEARAKSRSWTAAERAAQPKLDAMLNALARRDELAAEIAAGTRSPDGTLNELPLC